MKRQRMKICNKQPYDKNIIQLYRIDDNDAMYNKNHRYIPRLPDEKTNDPDGNNPTTGSNYNYESKWNKPEEIESVLNEYIDLCQRKRLSLQTSKQINDQEQQHKRLYLLLWKLREFAISPRGYCTDSIRQKVYPILVLGEWYTEKAEQEPAVSTQLQHKDHEQIRLDVVRSTWDHVPPYCVDKNYEIINKKQDLLIRYINNTLQTLPSSTSGIIMPFPIDAWKPTTIKNSTTTTTMTPSSSQSMHYYQGYHDVASVILSIMINNDSNENNTVDEVSSENGPSEFSRMHTTLLHQISCTHMKDYMNESFSSLQTAIHLTIRPMLWKLDPELYDHVNRCTADMHDSDNPSSLFIFALSWMLTWFSHDYLNIQNHNYPSSGRHSSKSSHSETGDSSTNKQALGTVGTNIEVVKRLFDLFIVSHPSMPIYITLAILLHPYNKRRILNTDASDYADVYYVLSQLHYNIVFEGGSYGDDDDNNRNPLVTSHYNAGVYNDAASDTSYSDDEYEILSEKDFVHVSDSHESSIDSSLIGIDDKDGISGRSQKRSNKSVVPLEEIISSALHFMHQIPPYGLLDLAMAHYGNGNPNLHEWLNDATRITIFHPLPIQHPGRTEINSSYGTLDVLAPGTQQDIPLDSSRVVSYESNESTPIVRYVQKDSTSVIAESNLVLNQVITNNSSSVSVIAAGFGSRTKTKNESKSSGIINIIAKFNIRKKRKRRLLIALLLTICVLVGLNRERIWIRLVQESKVSELPIHSRDATNEDVLHSNVNNTILNTTVANGLREEESLKFDKSTKPENLDEHYRRTPKVSHIATSDNKVPPKTDDTTNQTSKQSKKSDSVPVNIHKIDSLQPKRHRGKRSTQAQQEHSNKPGVPFFCPSAFKHFGCNIAGRSAQLLCLTDGTQVCRPINSDGSIDLFDLVATEIAECRPCQMNDENSRYAIAHDSNRNDTSSNSKLLTLRCPLEYGSCGKDELTVLTCELKWMRSTEEVRTTESAGIVPLVNGRERCMKAVPVKSTLYEVSFQDEDSCLGTGCNTGSDVDLDSSRYICGCCDGFDPDIDFAGKCQSHNDTDVSSTDGKVLFNKCCHPCRSQVPIAYRPCCCFMTPENENEDTCSNSNAWFSSTFGYENCRSIL